MRTPAILLLLICSFASRGEPLCQGESPIEPDMRIPESYFTQANANAALKELQSIVASDVAYDWGAVPNLQTVVAGYVLRRDAIAAYGFGRETKVAQFCQFLHTQAYWRD